VFWDLYSAAPERQEPNNHTHEAKAFHELVRDFNISSLSERVLCIKEN